MASDATDTVSLRVEVPRELRTRLKTQSARLGKTMSELLEELIEQPLRELELSALKNLKP
jgi:predicted DNA-binding protein